MLYMYLCSKGVVLYILVIILILFSAVLLSFLNTAIINRIDALVHFCVGLYIRYVFLFHLL